MKFKTKLYLNASKCKARRRAHAEQWPLHPQLVSFMQALTDSIVSEEKQCPSVNMLGLACNKFEFRGNMILISYMALGISHNATVHGTTVLVQATLPPPSEVTAPCMKFLTGLYLSSLFVK